MTAVLLKIRFSRKRVQKCFTLKTGALRSFEESNDSVSHPRRLEDWVYLMTMTVEECETSRKGN